MPVVRSSSLGPRVVRRVSLATVVSYALLVVSGGAVRLTGSGLGCPDWPSCYRHRFVAALSFHPLVEDVNRFFTGTVSVLSVVCLAVALLRSPRRRDLTLLSTGLVVGLVAQVVLGGVVVLTKLNPYLVAVHFLLTLAVVADAVVLYHRSRLSDDPAPLHGPRVATDLRWLVRVLLLVLACVSAAGTVVSGTGPHAGSPHAARIPLSFRSVAELHSSLAWLLLGLVAASLFAFRHARVPADIERKLRLFFELVMVQGALGYTQYFLHDAAAVVELHLAGVTGLWICGILLYLSLDGRSLLVTSLHEPPSVARATAEPLGAVLPPAGAAAAPGPVTPAKTG